MRSISAPSALIFGAAFTFVVVLAGCSEVKKVDEMKDNTSEMNQTTKSLRDKTAEMKDGLDKMSKSTDEMNEQTKKLGALTEEVASSTASLFDAMRQGDTSHLRREGFDKLMKESTLQGRVAEAGLYNQAFEFQVLGSVGKDKDQEFRDLLYHQAMLEFFLKIDEVAPKLGKVWPDAKPSLDDDEENRASAFNAIAFALHQVNRKQLADTTYGKPMSIYDLIIVSLSMKPDIDAGRIVLPRGSSFIKEVLSHPDRVQQLLQTRYNMFAYGMLGATTNLSEYSTIGQLMKLIFKIDIDLSEATRGVALLQRLGEEIVSPAATTTIDMVNLGMKPEFTFMTLTALSRVNLKFASTPKKTDFARMTARESTIQNLWTTYVDPATLQSKKLKR